MQMSWKLLCYRSDLSKVLKLANSTLNLNPTLAKLLLWIIPREYNFNLSNLFKYISQSQTTHCKISFLTQKHLKASNQKKKIRLIHFTILFLFTFLNVTILYTVNIVPTCFKCCLKHKAESSFIYYYDTLAYNILSLFKYI